MACLLRLLVNQLLAAKACYGAGAPWTPAQQRRGCRPKSAVA